MLADKPERLRESATEQYAYLNGPVNISCKTDANPPANFTWYRKSQKIPKNSEKYKITTDANHSTLFFIVKDKNDFAEFVCEAKNNHGMVKRTITIWKGTKPEPPPKIALKGKNSSIFDIDIGARKSTNPDLMDITGYVFQLTPLEDFEAHKWSTARTVEMTGKSKWIIFPIPTIIHTENQSQTCQQTSSSSAI